MKLVKTNVAQIKAQKVLPISHICLYFSNYIGSKYTILRKSSNLPALKFLKLFGTGIMNKITNIYLTELINNHFRPHLNFYLRMLSQLKQISSHYYQSQKLPYPADYGETKFQPETKISNSYSLDLSNSSTNVIARSVATKHSPQSHISNSPIPLLLKMGEWELPRGQSRIFGVASLISRNPSLKKRGIDYPSFLKSSSLITPLQKEGEVGLFAALSGANVSKEIIQEERGVLRSRPPCLSLRGEAEEISKIGASSTISKDEIPHEAYPEQDHEILRYAQNDKQKAWNDRLIIFSRQNQNVFLRRIIDKYLKITGKDISLGMILNRQKATNPALKRGTNIFSVIDYPEAGNNSKDVNYYGQENKSAFFNGIPHYRLPKWYESLIHKGEIASLPLTIPKRNIAMIERHIINKYTELILRKPITQNTNISESKDYQHKEKIISPKMTGDLTKDLKEKSAYEINMIADKVYKILEKRISIEKDRKGLH